MNWRSGVVFAALAACATIPAGTASAQYFTPPPPVYREAPPANSRGLPPSWIVDEDDDRALPAPGIGRPTQIVPGQGPVSSQGYPVNPAPQLPGTLGPSSQPTYQSNQAPQQPFARGPADQDVIRPPGDVGGRPTAVPRGAAQPSVATLPPEDQPEVGEPKAIDPRFKKQLVDFPTAEPAGTVVIDTSRKFLYLTLGGGKAIRYGIGVGRDGFTWAGTERISKMAEWPDWHPPAEMIERQPYLPRFMAGGDGNPLGARALYLGKTLYRIHGTNQPSTIGTNVSSGCIRLINADIEDLYSRVQTGTRVVVLPASQPPEIANAPVPGAPMNLGSNLPTGAINSAPLPAIR